MGIGRLGVVIAVSGACILPGLAGQPRLPAAGAPGLVPTVPCRSTTAGAPAVLRHLLLAQAETKPFDPALAAGGGPVPDGKPALMPGLGDIGMIVTTRSEDAQRYFDQGLRLSFAFNHAEAQRAFRAAQRLDPLCAMCFWGEALVLGPNINAPMQPAAMQPALEAIGRARALADSATPREQALIAALSRRYSKDPEADRASLDKAYADAMGQVVARYPTDDNVETLYAESLMNLSPWDYWEGGGVRPKGRAAEMIAALERVLQRNPRHPGAIHLYIHAVEASTAPERALTYARRLGKLAPGAGHLVHMPSHIYYRVGLYRDSLEANREAVAVDERYFSRNASDPFYRNAYYPHNLHFLMVSAQMGGDGRTAIEAAAKLDRVIDDDMLKAAAALQPVKAAPYFTHAQFSSPDTVLALPDPGDELVLVKAMWHYARAVAHSLRKDVAAAEKEIAALARIEAEGDFQPFVQWQVPGQEIVQTARLVAGARLADARGDLEGAARAYREAIALQDRLAYMEPPYWYYPVRQSLGAVLLRLGRLDEAEKAFRDSLALVPNNGWALYGLQQVMRRRGDAAAERAAGEALARAWFGDRTVLDVTRL